MKIMTLVGLVAAFCTTISFVPQALKTIRTKDTSGISLGMYALFTVGVATWLLYGILCNDWPIIIANAVTVVLSGIILGYKIKYK